MLERITHPFTQTLGLLLVPTATEQARDRKCGTAEGSHPNDKFNNSPMQRDMAGLCYIPQCFNLLLKTTSPGQCLISYLKAPPLPSITEKEDLHPSANSSNENPFHAGLKQNEATPSLSIPKIHKTFRSSQMYFEVLSFQFPTTVCY